MTCFPVPHRLHLSASPAGASRKAAFYGTARSHEREAPEAKGARAVRRSARSKPRCHGFGCDNYPCLVPLELTTRHRCLPRWNEPASPCPASRVPGSQLRTAPRGALSIRQFEVLSKSNAAWCLPPRPRLRRSCARKVAALCVPWGPGGDWLGGARSAPSLSRAPGERGEPRCRRPRGRGAAESREHA
jgi:hypothetical protein